MQDLNLKKSGINDWKIDENWTRRIINVKMSRHNNLISRGKCWSIINSYIIMHNGVKIYANSYYGSGMFNLLIQNKGVHEPQEEKIFEEINNYLKIVQCLN